MAPSMDHEPEPHLRILQTGSSVMTGLVQLYSLAASANAIRLETPSQRDSRTDDVKQVDAPVELGEDGDGGDQLVADREDMAEEGVDCEERWISRSQCVEGHGDALISISLSASADQSVGAPARARS